MQAWDLATLEPISSPYAKTSKSCACFTCQTSTCQLFDAKSRYQRSFGDYVQQRMLEYHNLLQEEIKRIPGPVAELSNIAHSQVAILAEFEDILLNWVLQLDRSLHFVARAKWTIRKAQSHNPESSGESKSAFDQAVKKFFAGPQGHINNLTQKIKRSLPEDVPDVLGPYGMEECLRDAVLKGFERWCSIDAAEAGKLWPGAKKANRAWSALQSSERPQRVMEPSRLPVIEPSSLEMPKKRKVGMPKKLMANVSLRRNGVIYSRPSRASGKGSGKGAGKDGKDKGASTAGKGKGAVKGAGHAGKGKGAVKGPCWQVIWQ